MKILYVITKANWGGAQRYVFDLATAAKGRGFDVAVAYGGSGRMAEKLTEAGVRRIEIPLLQRDVEVLDEWRVLFSLVELFKKEAPDVVHLNSSKIGALGGIAARWVGIKNIVFTDHGWAFMEKRIWPVRVLIWLASCITCLLAHKIIAVSDYELELTKEMPFAGEKALRIYNGIDLDMKFGSGEVIRRAFPAGVKITGTVGELTHNKNQIAMVERARVQPDMYTAIVGEGELRNELEQRINKYNLQDRVKLFGFKPAQDVLKGFDVFALPSLKEGLSYVVLEARAAGLPIDANRVGGVSEALDKPLKEFSLDTMVDQTFALYR